MAKNTEIKKEKNMYIYTRDFKSAIKTTVL